MERLHLVHVRVRERRTQIAQAHAAMTMMADEALVDLLRDIDQALVEQYGEPKHAFYDTRAHHSETERGCGWCGLAADDVVHMNDSGQRIEA